MVHSYSIQSLFSTWEQWQGVDWLGVIEIEAHLEDTCNEILTLLTDKLIPRAQKEGEEMVFYLKMKGDYYRYLSEFSTGDKRQTMASNSLAAYQEASDVAAKSLSVTDPVYLGLALNFSVFYYEILDKPQNACRLAQTAFENASTELGDLDPKHQKDAGLILQLLKDNLTLWTADLDEQTGDDGVKLQDMDD